MIHEALRFLVAQLNEYLYNKMGVAGLVIRQRLVKGDGLEVHITSNRVVCQLVNVEEERVGKAQMPLAQPVSSGFPVRNPEIRLNLSVMFTAVGGDGSPGDPESDAQYETSIQLLSLVIQFFQYRHYFTVENSPSLPAAIENLVVELYPISLENQNYLWASLGAKYRPSVVYKVRLITIFEDSFSGIVGTPKSIQIDSETLPNN